MIQKKDENDHKLAFENIYSGHLRSQIQLRLRLEERKLQNCKIPFTPSRWDRQIHRPCRLRFSIPLISQKLILTQLWIQPNAAGFLKETGIFLARKLLGG